jgi:outer membrane protein
MKTLLKTVALGVAMTAMLAAPAVRAADDEGPWLIRLRAMYISPADKSDPIALPTLTVPADQVQVSSKWAPEIDFEYFFTPHWSSELVLTYPQSHDVSVKGVGGVGSFKHLPPTLTGKYNFMPDSVFRPYVGLGVNLTFISDVSITVPAGVGGLPSATPVSLDSTSVGPAGQIGADFKLADHWYGNVDAKYVLLRTDAKAGGVKITSVKVDPWLLSLGIGYRFGGAPAPAPMPAPKPVAPPPAPAPVAAPTPPPPAPKPVAPPPPAQEVALKGVNFETASAKLKPESTAVLDGVVANIRKCNCGKVAIRGYTDSVGKPAYNQKLSERRANSVKDYLVAHGTAADMLTAEGFGEENPVASNKTAAGRAENRRVTVQFTELVSH